MKSKIINLNSKPTSIAYDGDIEGFLASSRQRLREDHEAKHEHVQAQVQSCPDDIHTVTVGYGGQHMFHGFHEDSDVSPVPLETYFSDCRVFVFEPHKFVESVINPEEVKLARLHLPTATIQSIRASIDFEVQRIRAQILSEL